MLALALESVAPMELASLALLGTQVEGRVLAQRWRLLSQLGKGGMGSVWRAEHLELGTPAAIKLIEASIADSEEALARFKREAQSAATLRSPHVVQILDYGVDQGMPYIAMELLEGDSLAARLSRLGRLPPEMTATLLTHVARAVSKAHEIGVVHRDLKPDNIFIVRNDDEELAKVLDFGIAKKTRDGLGSTSTPDTRTGAMLGTPFYMSPEQAIGRKAVDHRTDIWAMAVIAFECLTGRRPFVDETLGGLVMAICTDPIPLPSSVAQVPAGFDEWFAHGTQRDPSLRFQSAREAVEQLRLVCGLEGRRSSLPSTADQLEVMAPPQPRGWRLESTEAQLPASSITLGRSRKGRHRSMLVVAAVVAVAGAALAAVAITSRDADQPVAAPSAMAPAAAGVLTVEPELGSDSLGLVAPPPASASAPVVEVTPAAAAEPKPAAAAVAGPQPGSPVPPAVRVPVAPSRRGESTPPSTTTSQPKPKTDAKPARTTRSRLDSELGL